MGSGQGLEKKNTVLTVTSRPELKGKTLMANALSQLLLGNFKVVSADVRINPDVSDFTWVDFHRAQKIIEKGVEAAERELPNIKRAIAERS
jgi:predicted acylesterase/phospholipase RssA